MSKFEPTAATINLVITPPDDFADEVADKVIDKLNRKNTWDRAQLLLVEWTSLFSTHTSTQPEMKLAEEVAEFLEAEHDTDAKLLEAADEFIVVATQLTYEGYTIDDLAHAVQEKLMVNLARTWAKNPDGTISHVKDVSENAGVEDDSEILFDDVVKVESNDEEIRFIVDLGTEVVS